LTYLISLESLISSSTFFFSFLCYQHITSECHRSIQDHRNFSWNNKQTLCRSRYWGDCQEDEGVNRVSSRAINRQVTP